MVGLRSWQFDVASNLLQRTTAFASDLASAIDRFPLDAARGRPEANFRKAAYDVMGLQVPLQQAGEQLHDTPLEPLIATAFRRAETSAPRLRALALSITLEDRAAQLSDRPWTWSGAMAAFNAEVLPAMTEPALCGWETLIDGGYLHELDDATHSLIRVAMNLVMAPPQREHVGYVIRRGSAHEELVRGNRRWCEICGWLDAISVPTENQRFYHSGISGAMSFGPHN